MCGVFNMACYEKFKDFLKTEMYKLSYNLNNIFLYGIRENKF